MGEIDFLWLYISFGCRLIFFRKYELCRGIAFLCVLASGSL